MLLSLLLDFLNKNPNIKKNSKNNTNYGFQIGPTRNFENKVIKKIVITLEPTLESIIYAKKIKSNLIICYFPLFQNGCNRINDSLMNKLFLLTQNHIMVYILNPLMVSYDQLLYILGLDIIDVIDDYERNMNESIIICENLLSKKDFDQYLIDLKRKMGIKYIQYYKNSRNSKNPLEKIALYMGKCISSDNIKKIYSLGCTCVITGDIGYSELSLIRNFNLSLIKLSQYSIIKPGMEKITKILSSEFPQVEIQYFDCNGILDII